MVGAQRTSRPDAQPARRVPVVALAGNPNAGKTSLFNALTGQNQHVGNYPGVTVDKVTGRLTFEQRDLDIVDLPGTYSLTAYSIEEVVTRDFVLQERPDVVVDVIDTTNLERNLYLLLQLQELGVPVVGALNMSDEAERKGIHVDVQLLSRLLGIPLVCTVGTKGTGKRELLQAVFDVVDGRADTVARHLNYGPELEEKHEEVMKVLEGDPSFAGRFSLHWMAIKLLENDPDARAKVQAHHAHAGQVLEAAREASAWVARHFGQDPEVVVGEQRYAYIRGACREAVRVELRRSDRPDMTELVDTVVLNRVLGVPIFFLVMLAIYTMTFLLGNPLSDLVQRGFGLMGRGIEALLPAGVLRDFLVEGMIAGVGGVLGFFPLAMLLFLGLSFLEDVGYMARAAFVMDKFLHLFGLHGRSFIPLMVSTGCAVPGVMSARTLTNPRDRIVTVLISPLMMCGAKTPVIAMLCAAFFPKHAVLVFWALWLFGWAMAFTTGLVFRKTLFRGEDSPFVMELPPYRLPTVRGVFTHMWQKSASYVRKAGTFILAASVIIWAALTFPKPHSYSQDYAAQAASVSAAAEVKLAAPELPAADRPRIASERDQSLAALARQKKSEEASASIAGTIGRAVQPVMKYAGFDWKTNVALLSGVAAKEVIISTMGIVHGLGEVEAPEDAEAASRSPLTASIRRDSSFTPASALALMIFVMIYVPCIATLAVARKELGSIKWPAFMAAYTLVVAYLFAVIVNQAGRWFS
jgi:ferrous iron transport protein B